MSLCGLREMLFQFWFCLKIRTTIKRNDIRMIKNSCKISFFLYLFNQSTYQVNISTAVVPPCTLTVTLCFEILIIKWLIDWLTDWLMDWFIDLFKMDWLIDWFIDWLMDCTSGLQIPLRLRLWPFTHPPGQLELLAVI